MKIHFLKKEGCRWYANISKTTYKNFQPRKSNSFNSNPILIQNIFKREHQ